MIEWGLASIAGVALLFGFVVFVGAPYVPTRRKDISEAFTSLYPLSKQDVVVDIGSGDGVVLRQAAVRGARAIGYELNPVLVVISRLLSRGQAGVSVYLADFWHAPLPDDTTLVYTFGETRDIGKMYAKVQREATRLGRPLYFMSYAFAVKDQTPLRANRSYFLYEIAPLQDEKP